MMKLLKESTKLPNIDCIISFTVFKNVLFNKHEVGGERDFPSCPLRTQIILFMSFQLNQLQIPYRFFFSCMSFTSIGYRLHVRFITNFRNMKNARYFPFGVLQEL